MAEYRQESHGDHTLAALAADWPDWKIWTSSEGRYVCGTRRKIISCLAIERGLSRSLIADSADELADLLREEADLEAMLI